ncbi:hypothetical protein HYH03_003848 [Edaphochlamys debaryana]|uniref:Uncharacterized protein n=1 Tax=Edaphochlamys debaryana TaxID=47281 RepID=A0A835Y883_9CHLO|nr:hypothetical protein HYH03_003848 [Edaphochlamys debaryana]|eukprot:KAG2498090.1 hypothetical protein HYH03_003848 [Edaphochlamys debaryana]
MPAAELEEAAQRVRQLEAAAIAAHERAQALNKEGRFQEAQAAYAEMHALEDQASELAARVGCVACVLGDDDAAQDPAEASLCNLDMDSLEPYSRLHPAAPWAQGPGGAAAAAAARAAAAVVGSAVADAAAMGVHWVYDLSQLEVLEAERRAEAAAASTSAPAHPSDFGLEFLDPPRSPFYSYASGRNSPYGEQTLALLRSLAEQGGLHAGAYADTFEAAFGPDSGFDGYRDVSTKGFLRNYARAMPPPLSGANDAQANAIARLAPLVAAFGAAPAPTAATAATATNSSTATAADADAGAPSVSGSGSGEGAEEEEVSDLLECVELATRVTQNTDAAVAWACAGAAVLDSLLRGGTAAAAVEGAAAALESGAGPLAARCGPLAPELAAHLRSCLALAATPVPEAVAKLGRNCHMPNALQTPLQVVLYVEHHHAQAQAQARLPPAAYVEGVRLAIREGGCCASRAAYVGACLGALCAPSHSEGEEGAQKEGEKEGVAGALVALPQSWIARYGAAEQVTAWAGAILAARARAE